MDSLLGAYKQFSTRLGYGGLDKEVGHLRLLFFVFGNNALNADFLRAKYFIHVQAHITSSLS